MNEYSYQFSNFGSVFVCAGIKKISGGVGLFQKHIRHNQ